VRLTVWIRSNPLGELTAISGLLTGIWRATEKERNGLRKGWREEEKDGDK